MLRVVVDAGVLISAILSRGPPAQLLDRWRDGELDLIASPRLLSELRRVLLRDKFRAYVTEPEVTVFVAALTRGAVVIEDPPTEEGPTPDPGDDYVVFLARAAGADCIVSGGRHLTGLPGPDPPVLTARALLTRLNA
ncbi:putative toxin-antitoxin system toxin component, PIN family [soil metagenome]